jgi:hypothetical protein
VTHHTKMAFNNPSSRTPVSYASATKSLGYLAKVCMNVFNSDEQDEQTNLLNKRNKGKEESRIFVISCCVCIFLLILVVVGFVVALKSLSYPHMVPIHKETPITKNALGPALKTAAHLKHRSRGRQQHSDMISEQSFHGRISADEK